MQHIYFNPRALDSCTLFVFSFVEDCHVLLHHGNEMEKSLWLIGTDLLATQWRENAQTDSCL